FGDPQSGETATRKQKLMEVLEAQSLKPASPTLRDDPTHSGNAQSDTVGDVGDSQPLSTPPPPPKKPDATDYPTVTSLERKVFGQDFRQEDISDRLNHLEEKLFGKTAQNLELVDRVDKLVAASSSLPAPRTQSSHVFPEQGAQYPGNGSVRPSSSGDAHQKVSYLEATLLGHSYSGQLLSERVERMERKAFGSTFGSDSLDTRMNRLMMLTGGTNYPSPDSSSSGGGSRPFQNQVYPNTSSQSYIRPESQYQNYGTSAPDSSSGYSSNQMAVPRRAPHNIQIGSGLSSRSQVQYSQDLLNMLPNDVRGRVSQQTNTNNGGNYTASAPGRVYLPQPQNASPDSYGSPPSRNLYANPAGIGQFSPYANSPGGNPSPVTNPVSQHLANLEMMLYGQVYQALPNALRLNQLEAKVLGQNYVGYPDIDRINNLERAIQLQSTQHNSGRGRNKKNSHSADSGFLYGVPMQTPSLNNR
ncbi:MAG: hypothetical protein K2X66_15070, partial [Cyanobacteria bacterium]|nr:hypothetical protein [Cyanobacteriota bacterium]